jgi:hypothetical protein
VLCEYKKESEYDGGRLILVIPLTIKFEILFEENIHQQPLCLPLVYMNPSFCI